MDLNWLEDFVALAEARNFSRAAERRHVTQPAFSRRIRSLEDAIGVPLFERTPTGVRLTAAGEQFDRGAADLLRRLATLVSEAREAGGRETATLRIAATHALSFTFFPLWIRAVEGRGAVAPVRLISDSMAACEEMMLRGETQFLLCHHHAAAPGPLDGRVFRRIDVGEDRLTPFAAPDGDGRPRWTLDGPAPFLAYDEPSGLGRIWASQGFADSLPALDRVFSARLAATLMTMACEGRGIAWLPESLAERDVALGRLVPCGGPGTAIPLTIAVYRPAARQSPSAEAFGRLIAAG
jgi:LysR family transcriptional regulator, hypochlorite-specific transcription factor HypT